MISRYESRKLHHWYSIAIWGLLMAISVFLYLSIGMEYREHSEEWEYMLLLFFLMMVFAGAFIMCRISWKSMQMDKELDRLEKRIELLEECYEDDGSE